ncbi:hypothetical protein GCM10020256_64010 [Streptomyces thermocoprophilus]
MPTRHGRSGPGAPNICTSPPPLTLTPLAPAASSARAARSVAQPFTMPVGSKEPAYRRLNQPSLTRSASVPSSSTSATSGSQPSNVSSPRASRETWLSSR